MKKIYAVMGAVALCTPLFTFGATFNQTLTYGSKNASVSQLQNFLTNMQLYSGPINGSYGPLTKAGVMAFQKSEGIKPVNGSFGPLTRARANTYVEGYPEAFLNVSQGSLPSAKNSVDLTTLKTTYVTTTQAFSIPVTVTSYEILTEANGSGKIVLHYAETTIPTYVTVTRFNTLYSPYTESTLKSLIGKKVTVLIPPFQIFTQPYLTSSTNPHVYARTEFDGYDLELSISEKVPMTLQETMPNVSVDISPASNLNNLTELPFWKNLSDRMVNENYIQYRYTELCSFLTVPRKIVDVGILGKNSNALSEGGLYVVLEGQPKTRFLFNNVETVLQLPPVNTYSQADADAILAWLRQTFISGNLKMKGSPCPSTTMPNNFRDTLGFRSVYAETPFGRSAIPTTENIVFYMSILVDSAGNEDTSFNGSGISYLYANYKNQGR